MGVLTCYCHDLMRTDSGTMKSFGHCRGKLRSQEIACAFNKSVSEWQVVFKPQYAENLLTALE